MADVMVSPQATWAVPTTNSNPANSLQENQFPVTQRSHFHSDTRQSRTANSASRETAPVMEESGCDSTDGCLFLGDSVNEEADTLMNMKLPGEEGEQENTETDQDDIKQTQITNGGHHHHGHHFNDLIKRFESAVGHDDQGEEGDDTISASQVEPEESIIGDVGGFINDIGGGLNDVVHTIADGVHTIADGVKKVVQKTLYVFPSSHTDEDEGASNIRVQHPSLTGNIVSLGMNMHKGIRGHLVQSVTPGGLAHKAHIKNNDIIRKVNDTDVGDWEFEKLQEFFSSQTSIVIKLVVERENGVDENGQPRFITFTLSIELTFEDDRVVAEIDVSYTAWPLGYYGEEPSELSTYLICQEGIKTSKYLSLSEDFCGMTTKCTQNCYFKMYAYSPGVGSPRVLYNTSMKAPVDLGKKSRIGTDNGLTGTGISTTNDKRFFYYRKQGSLCAFELMAKEKFFLTVNDDGTITEKYFSDLKSVPSAGLFTAINPSKAKPLFKK
ncbi:uncharacterized protein LOC117298237 [Asterias rubens]|uniref:uncharacterized protein LOC117298237 n=1 Tax=Asterias rubens TaxID=7604 RepID=UPI001454F1F0|nr:uncharacterized protein LOC117298237 [Asterias rubens]